MSHSTKIIAGFALIFIALQNRGAIHDAFSPPPAYVLDAGSVVLYSTTWCGYCKKVKSIFRSHHVDFIEYDIEKSNAAYKTFQALGGQGVPLIQINGEVLRGYDREKIKELLRKHSKSNEKSHSKT